MSGFAKELKNAVWPIENKELPKFLPMAFMMMCILFNYAVLRSIKDSLIVVNIGAEAINFLKFYVVLPSAVLAMIVYSKLCNVTNAAGVFYAISAFFIAYLLAFALFIYPNPTVVHPDPAWVDSLAAQYDRWKWFIKIMGKWSYASFYVIAELWGSLMVSLLFWQFANSITATAEAKRFYAMFGMLGNLGLPIAGSVLKMQMADPIETTKFKVLMTAISAVAIVMSYYWLNTRVLPYQDAGGAKTKKTKMKLSLGESFKMILSSRYLALIALLIISYSISTNLVEVAWKAKARALYRTVESYQNFMGNFQIIQGYGTIIFMLIGSNILRKLSWKTAALITPLMFLVTGLGFFSFVIFDDIISAYLSAFLSGGALAFAVSLGTWQQVLGKGTKYSLFDPTKEMSYIPLDDEMKSKGKAAVDVIGGRLGKSGGAFIQSTTFILFPSLTFAEAIPYFAVIFTFIVLLWLYAVSKLNVEYNKKLAAVATN